MLRLVCLSLLAFTSYLHAGDIVSYRVSGTTVDPGGHQVDTFSIHLDGDWFSLSYRYKDVDTWPNGSYPKNWYHDISFYLFSPTGTPIGAGHGEMYSQDSFGAIGLPGLAKVAPGDYTLWVTSYNNRAFDSAGNEIFARHGADGNPTYNFLPNPGVGSLDHFSIAGSTPGTTYAPNDYYVAVYYGSLPNVPEPGSIALFGIGMAGLAAVAWRKARKVLDKAKARE